LKGRTAMSDCYGLQEYITYESMKTLIVQDDESVLCYSCNVQTCSVMNGTLNQFWPTNNGQAIATAQYDTERNYVY
jgi:hypothetical protein